MILTLKNPSLLEINTEQGVQVGGSQEWYTDGWRRKSGCGPTAASNLIWYLTQTRPALDGLCGDGGFCKESFALLMSEMFTFVTPGLGGVNTSKIFTDGVVRYGNEHGITLSPNTLEIPKNAGARPTVAAAMEFISSGLQSDCPIAFLNLSNGNQNILDSWHWTILIAAEPETANVSVSDQGKVFEIDLAEWLKTSLFGGACVYLTVQ